MATNNLRKKNELVRNEIDVFNEKVQQAKKILSLRNNFLKISNLNELLHYTTCQVAQNESAETDERMEVQTNSTTQHIDLLHSVLEI